LTAWPAGGPPLAVWDVDGTLVDSRALIDACMREALVAAGQPAPTYDAVRQIVGLGLAEACAVLAPQLEGAALDRLVALYRQAFNDRRRRPGFTEPLYAGAAETLARLQARGWKLAMATGKSRRGVEHIIALHDWHDVFHTTHCDEDGPGKPDPAMLLAAMAAMDAAPSRTMMIGDTSHDMKMARAAGAYAQGVSWGFHTEAEVRAAGAQAVAHDFAELDAALDRFAAG
jgi:phosphoglycolate phosphatase